jgi:hypothetical protein
VLRGFKRQRRAPELELDPAFDRALDSDLDPAFD